MKKCREHYQWHFFDKFFKFFFVMITNWYSVIKTVSISAIDSLLVMAIPVISVHTSFVRFIPFFVFFLYFVQNDQKRKYQLYCLCLKRTDDFVPKLMKNKRWNETSNDNRNCHTFGFSGHLLNSGFVLLNGAKSLSTKEPKPIFRSLVIFVMLPMIWNVGSVMVFLISSV